MYNESCTYSVMEKYCQHQLGSDTLQTSHWPHPRYPLTPLKKEVWVGNVGALNVQNTPQSQTHSLKLTVSGQTLQNTTRKAIERTFSKTPNQRISLDFLKETNLFIKKLANYNKVYNKKNPYSKTPHGKQNKSYPFWQLNDPCH